MVVNGGTKGCAVGVEAMLLFVMPPVCIDVRVPPGCFWCGAAVPLRCGIDAAGVEIVRQRVSL